ncbi:hypothetical protein [Mucilaginibacter auburnensis]|uniref:Uncharacterized protein n=1 Tax=Mucilaginibacter auburnensis TaxID=1457233 RepID=A0A2H9VUD2_9SPHI|nr:hypothetical protein [Mucilaginibacter auburnensis]PJJ84427.1 hypothetical protein CLV57_1439 [Mucilaginibacter auburnensis]
MNNSELIKDQTFDDQFSFLTTCLGRTRHLYTLFEMEIANDDFSYALRFKNASRVINKLYEECVDIIFSARNNFSVDLSSLYKLAPSYEEYTTAYATIATQIALMCTSIAEFCESRDAGLINEVLMNLEEIINIIRSENFYRQNLPGDTWEYVTTFLEKEYADQREIIKQISDQDLSKELFQELINSYEVKI